MYIMARHHYGSENGWRTNTVPLCGEGKLDIRGTSVQLGAMVEVPEGTLRPEDLATYCQCSETLVDSDVLLEVEPVGRDKLQVLGLATVSVSHVGEFVNGRPHGAFVRWPDNSRLTFLGGLLHSYSDLPAAATSIRHEWWCCGRRHRDNDQPAIVTHAKRKWFRHGLKHRDGDEPAVVYADGTRKWYRFGVLHRDGDKPAVCLGPSGLMKWYWQGYLHRGDDKPAVVHRDGTQEWYELDKRCRKEDQPVVVGGDGCEKWWKHDHLCPHMSCVCVSVPHEMRWMYKLLEDKKSVT
jgi:hypothetical protein